VGFSCAFLSANPSFDPLLQQTSGNKKAEEEANKEAEVKVKEIKAAGEKGGDKVIDELIQSVISPMPEVPEKLSREED
jgi:V-type H+-transporting ATPase subunit G